MSSQRIKSEGFSLIELSAVMIIIALILAGISGGSHLLEQANLRSVITDFQEYKTNYNTFTKRFNRVPGDMDNAFNFWGTECGANATVCNGNSDNIVNGIDNSSSDEVAKAWRHMKLADLANGDVTPIIATYTGLIVVGENTPTASLDQAGYFITGGDLNANSSYLTHPWDNDLINAVYIGRNSATSSPTLGALNAKQAYYLDSKFDDGRIDNSGNIIGHSSGKLRFINDQSTGSGCINTGTYNIDSTTETCIGGYELQKR
jgi:prepilin-type N-terminal cleavage/methylation domain-containing protein